MKATESMERHCAASVAMGDRPADLVLRGGRVVNVHTGRVERADVAVAGDRIAVVGDVSYTVDGATDLVDCTDQYIVPGLLDAHIHLGGSQLAVPRLAELLVPHGTVAVCTDFYEICTIGGLGAAFHELDLARGTGLEILLSPFNAAVLGLGELGNLGRFSYQDLLALMEHESCIELREWNCWADKIPFDGQRKIYEAALRSGLALGGHLEGLAGRSLQASTALGVRSDHEAVTTSEALERVQHGMYVQVREGSAARDFASLVQSVTAHGADARHFAFCTDEQELGSMSENGHLDRLVRRAVREGVSPVDAIRMASLNAAISMGIDQHLGSVTPGRLASMIVVDDLATFPIDLVLSRGRVAAQRGNYLLPRVEPTYPDSARETVRIGSPLVPEDFRLDAPDGLARLRVIGVTPGSLVTDEQVTEVRVEHGGVVDWANADLAKIAVIDRHDGGSEQSVGLIRGFGIRRGAIAATVNPGMMNLLVVGVRDVDLAVAANRVAEMGGGIAVAVDGAVVAEVALPLYGILSDAPLADVSAACAHVDRAIETDLGTKFEGLLSAAGFACLAVSIPSLKITARGLARVTRGGPVERVNLVVPRDAQAMGLKPS